MTNLKDKIYRDKGAIGALLDEYEKAIEELINLLSTVSLVELTTIVDHTTKDQDCKSIQTILTHVVKAGYAYSIYTRKQLGEDLEMRSRKSFDSISDYVVAIQQMFQYNVDMFDKYPDIKIEVFATENKMLTSWGQRYDIEQIYEHAIVHILRHRRQIERFLQKLRST